MDRFLVANRTSRVVGIASVWWARVTAVSLWVYEIAGQTFSLLDETAACYTSRYPVTPVGQQEIANVPAAILDLGYELRVMPSL